MNSHSYSATSGYSHLSTFAQTLLAGGYYFHPDEEESFYETTSTNKQVKASIKVCVSAYGLSNTTIKIVTLEAHSILL